MTDQHPRFPFRRPRCAGQMPVATGSRSPVSPVSLSPGMDNCPRISTCRVGAGLTWGVVGRVTGRPAKPTRRATIQKISLPVQRQQSRRVNRRQSSRPLLRFAGEPPTEMGLSAPKSGCSGLDTRPCRMALRSSVNWIEADLPAMTAYEETILAGELPGLWIRPRSRPVMNTRPSWRALERKLNGSFTGPRFPAPYLPASARWLSTRSSSRGLRRHGISS